jgi:hypothetical protein
MAGESLGNNWGSGSDGVVQLVVDQIEELIITLLEEVRTRPSVAIAILAGVMGAVVGAALAGRMTRPRRPAPTSATAEMLGALAGTLAGAVPRRSDGSNSAARMASRARKGARQGLSGPMSGLSGVGDVAELAGLGMRLLENPIVRSYLRAAAANQLRKRFGR